MDTDDHEHLQNTYRAEHEPTYGRLREGTALCLSGGGFRAALFHLGAVRRLNELGVLSQLDAISSVSGGSILSAHLLQAIQPWPAPSTVIDAAAWERQVAQPFRRFTRTDLRTGPVARAWLLPWNWFRRDSAVRGLAAAYRKRLNRMRLTDLPDRPRFIFCATDMQFGVNWVFEKRGIGDYQAGWKTPAPAWHVADAVAASSCFPPVFDPLRLTLKPDELKGGKARPEDRERIIPHLSLTDGGVYDNMGLEPVWKRCESVLVSDGGGTFDFEGDWNPLLRLLRYNTIQGNQAGAIRRRWLISNFQRGDFKGAYWRINTQVADFEETGYRQTERYPVDLVERVIAKIRTDLDAFAEAEIAVLENHGYLLAEAALKSRTPGLIARANAPLNIPHPEWMDPVRAAEVLVNSGKRVWFGRKG